MKWQTKIFSIIGIATLISSVAVCGASGKGGGDTVTCGADPAGSADIYDAVVKIGVKKAVPLTDQLEFDSGHKFSPYYLTEDEILDTFIDSVTNKEEALKLSDIRAHLHYEVVDHFSGEIPKTGHSVHFTGWWLNDCHTFFTARQYFESNKVEFISGHTSEYFFGNRQSDPNVRQKWGYDYTSDFGRAALKFHEIVLHLMWENNPKFSIEKLETQARDYIVSMLTAPGFLQVLVDKFNAQVIKKYEAINPMPLVCPNDNGEEGELECIVGKWAGVSYFFPQGFPVGLVWAGGHGKNASTPHPTRQDIKDLAKEINAKMKYYSELANDLERNIEADTWVIYDLLNHQYWLP